MTEPNFYWADITVKVMAPDKEYAESIVLDAAVQMESIYPGEIILKGTEVDDD